MRRTVRGSIVFFASLWISANAMAADPAPLPDGFLAEPTTTVSGVFARAVAYENQIAHEDALRELDRACIARGRLVESVGTSHHMLTTWWLYRTMTETAVFRRKVTVNLDRDACRVTYGEQREVFRSIDKAGDWPSPFSEKLRCSSFAKNCHSRQLLGVKARCRVEGNVFQLSRDCVSIERGPTRGLLLEAVYQSDDMSGSGFEVRELKSGVPLDASVFDRTRNW
jgi:hypothetical protein